VVAGGVLNGSVMFYFTHVVHLPGAGPAAMAWMGLAGVVATPAWMLVRDVLGARLMWLCNVALALGVTGTFWLAGGSGALSAQVYVVAMQIVGIGFAFAFWAMLPDTVEWGERRGGVRVEALSFGLASLGQKLALGAAAGLLGLAYHRAGYVPGADQTPAAAAAIRATLLGPPSVAIALSALAMLANPLRRNTHARLADELARRRAEG
jgi:Na+/melibiose symporter-like transporter